MANKEQFEGALAVINDETNRIAAKLEELAGIVAGAGMSAEDEATVLGELQAAADRLKGVGAPAPAEEPVA